MIRFSDTVPSDNSASHLARSPPSTSQAVARRQPFYPAAPDNRLAVRRFIACHLHRPAASVLGPPVAAPAASSLPSPTSRRGPGPPWPCPAQRQQAPAARSPSRWNPAQRQTENLGSTRCRLGAAVRRQSCSRSGRQLRDASTIDEEERQRGRGRGGSLKKGLGDISEGAGAGSNGYTPCGKTGWRMEAAAAANALKRSAFTSSLG